jgi:hypothetical protein
MLRNISHSYSIQCNIIIILHRHTPVATPMAAGDAFVFLFYSSRCQIAPHSSIEIEC